jgi:hypothetical protein
MWWERPFGRHRIKSFVEALESPRAASPSRGRKDTASDHGEPQFMLAKRSRIGTRGGSAFAGGNNTDRSVTAGN